LDQALVNLEIKRLSFLSSGPVPPNPIELLESEAFGHMMQSLTERADLVVLDSPPMLVVADGQILSSRADGTVLVLEMQRTRQEMVRQAQELLGRAHARVLGLVANRLRRGSVGYCYYY
jgi:protein-tyrosine kinase